jgi:agmatinase
MANSRRFLELSSQYYGYEQSRFVVIPCPHEATTSYGHGTKKGPAAILNASQKVETFDEELGYEPYVKAPIATLPPQTIKKIPAVIRKILSDKKIPVVLGGEHSLSPLVVKAMAETYPNLSVLQLDAHADLRFSYQGLKSSHACAMRRVLEICPAVQVGLRSISYEEWQWAKESGQSKKMHFASSLEVVEKIVNQLGKEVYITIDADVFDPSVLPAVGTPEPGGLFWNEVLDVLKAICKEKQVVGFDVVELSPRKGDIASDFTIAKLIYKIMGYLSLRKTF